jgi:hypothetical protein
MDQDDATFDERLLLVVAAGGLLVFLLFLATPVLRPYYALLMPLGIVGGAGTAWYLLRRARRGTP